MQVTSIRGYCGRFLYNNKIELKHLFPCESYKGEETGQSFCSFIELVGFPYSLHCDNHNNFKERLFKRLLRKFVIYQTSTEPH